MDFRPAPSIIREEGRFSLRCILPFITIFILWRIITDGTDLRRITKNNSEMSDYTGKQGNWRETDRSNPFLQVLSPFCILICYSTTNHRKHHHEKRYPPRIQKSGRGLRMRKHLRNPLEHGEHPCRNLLCVSSVLYREAQAA